MDTLRSFLVGYSWAVDLYKGDVVDDPFLVPREKFDDWVIYRLHLKSTTAGWHRRIREHCESENEAFDLFLRLYDEFHARQPQFVAKLANFQKAFGAYSESYHISDSVWQESVHRPPKNLNFITYTSDPGFFVEADDDPDFLRNNFFSSFEKFEYEFGVTRDQLLILDPNWNPA